MHQRLDLHEFQRDATGRMQALDHSAAQISTLGVQMAGRNWLADMHDVSEILPLPQLTGVPFTKPWFMGVINVRGALYGVTDIAAYLHLGKASGAPANRVLLVAARHAVNAALLVDCVLGLRGTHTWTQSGTDDQVQYQDEQWNTWLKLDIGGLLVQPDFLQIGA